MMKIEGFTENQILALVKTWKLGSPVDVLTFIGRADIPDEVKERVRNITASAAGVKAEHPRISNRTDSSCLEPGGARRRGRDSRIAEG